MLRNRFLILLGGCFLAVSAAWADDVGYVDCSNHSEGTQVFGKPRKSPDVLSSLPCGERFTVLVYGFVFSRIQTGDGKVGYVYSNVIAIDRAATSALQTGIVRLATNKTTVPGNTGAAVAKPTPPAPAQPQPTPAPPAPAPEPAPISSLPISNAPDTPTAVAHLDPPGSVQPQPAPAQPVPPPAPEPASISEVPEAAATVAQPNPPGPPQPEPSEAHPPAPSIRPASERATWEKPLPSSRSRAPLMELYGGYAVARLAGGAGTTSNLNEAMGSFGWNFKPWLQIVADSSYSVVTISSTKNVLYGNHF